MTHQSIESLGKPENTAILSWNEKHDQTEDL